MRRPWLPRCFAAALVGPARRASVGAMMLSTSLVGVGLGRLLVTALAWGAGALPRDTASRLGRLIGDCRRRSCPHEVEAVRGNLRRLGLTREHDARSRQAEDRILREAFRAFGLFAVEFFRGLQASPPEIVRDWRVLGWPHIEDLAVDPRGFIVACAHTGNWEQLSALAHPLGRRIVAPVEEQFHPVLSTAVKLVKRRRWVESPSACNGLRDLLRALDRGDLVALPLDGGTYRRGVTVRLLDARVSLARGAAQLSVMSGCPVVPVFAQRTAFMQQTVRVLEPLRPEPPGTRPAAARIEALAQRLADALGEQLRAAPDQWCIFRPLAWREEGSPAVCALPQRRTPATLRRLEQSAAADAAGETMGGPP